MEEKETETVKETEVVEIPLCARSKTNPKWELTKRATGEKHFWSLCKECETDRQKENRGRRKARNTSLIEVVSAKPAAILAKYEVETVGELIKSQVDVTFIKGFGPKSHAALASFVKEAGLDLTEIETGGRPRIGVVSFFHSGRGKV